MRKGFTLIELIIVITIIGILATMGASQYRKTVEISRQVEAKTTLNMLRSANMAYKIENTNSENPDGKYAGPSKLGYTGLHLCSPDRWFSYSCNLGDTPEPTCNAYRCAGPGYPAGSGKKPDWHVNYRVKLKLNSGEFSVANIQTGE